MSAPKKQLVYYGWIVVAIGFLACVIAYAPRYNFSIFYVAILNDFGWSREATALAFSINLIVYAISAPISGILFDKFGIRKVVPIGAVLLGLSLVACSRIAAIWQLYLVIGLTAFGSCAVGFVPNLALVANWFSRRRGLAIGILNGGIISGMLLAPIVQYLISTIGWRGTFLVIAGFSAIILAPLVAIFQRQRPEDKGLIVDGIEEGQRIDSKIMANKSASVRSPSPDLALIQVIKTYRFWWVVLMFLFLGLYLYTLLVHQVAYLTDAGYSKTFAAEIVATLGAIALGGGLCTFLSDRYGREIIYTISSVSAFIGLLVLMLIRDNVHPWMPYLYAVFFGFPYGLNTSVMAATAADLFHGKHFGTINGVLMGFFVSGGAIGPWFAGRVFDMSGNYAQVFPLLYFAVFASVVFIWLAAPRKIRKL